MFKDNVIGMIKEVEIVVGESDTAIKHGSGSLQVLATPAMIGLMENAAAKLAESSMDMEEVPKDVCTVGTSINISHMAATPVGMRVKAVARIKEIDGRRIVFEVEAFDEVEKIGEGIHERFVVFGEKFMVKANSKLG